MYLTALARTAPRKAPRKARRAWALAVAGGPAVGYKFYWNSSASPFMTGLSAGTYSSAPDPYIPVYVNGTLVYGQTPPVTADDSC